MFFLRSGIPSLDRMFRPSGVQESDVAQERTHRGVVLADRTSITSICVAGPDGTGKSVLAMHFASRYAADSHQVASDDTTQPLVFYVSTDLSYTTANQMWQNFGLDHPNTRRVPHCYPQLQREPRSPEWLGGRPWDVEYQIPLIASRPDDLGDLVRYLTGTTSQRQIAFVDLASHAAGDDWGLIERLLATMPDAAARMPRHLLVLDAMEGMETFAGEFDAFGEKVERRGRIAKLMRLARKKCHLIVVSEEPREGTRLPEQFVADVVLRLRTTETQGYARRSVEIEKARGQSHIRGRHPYVIRDGRGSTTGTQMNFDDPVVMQGRKCQSYIDVLPSLHALAREIMEKRGTGREPLSGRVAGFGIPELDEMLAVRNVPFDAPHLHGDDDRGLPSGAVSALIGDANTQKSYLGVAFLGHLFHKMTWEVIEEAVRARKYRSKSRRAWAAQIARSHAADAGAAVLITTKDENCDTIVGRFYQQLHDEMTARIRREGLGDLSDRIDQIWNDDSFGLVFESWLKSRTLVRRLEIHDSPSPVLFHIIRRSIDAAQQLVLYGSSDVCIGGSVPDRVRERGAFGWRIRIVIDDFNSLVRTYGKTKDDPLFLPFLLFSLKREGLSALIIETQSGAHGMPALVVGEDAQSDLRALSDYRLYTWHVPDFFGDHRIAIAAIPPMVKEDRKSPVRVRELEWYPPNSESRPTVNPEFELYAGLETGRPTLVPLQLHLYAETPAWEAYISHLDHLWRRVFDPPTPPSADARRSVVTAERSEDYELLRELCDLHANTSLDYSLILQIDEFWHHRDSFRSQTDYLNAVVEVPDGMGTPGIAKRRTWFGELPSPANDTFLDRVPFVWDFGFLAFRERLWNEATMVPTSVNSPDGDGEMGTLEMKRLEIGVIWQKLREGLPCSWREVLEAASYVARWESARQPRPVPAFDLAMVAPETFSCLVLELWFSEIYETIQLHSVEEAEAFADGLHTRDWTDTTSNRYDLAGLVHEYWSQLYRSWLLLVEVLDLSAFSKRGEGFGFGFGRKADANAVVVRHWYKSASEPREGDQASGPVRYCRLPGRFAVRGDWYLATVRGSRSDRLADRAVDLLSTPAANTDRLMRGVGLPTRVLQADPELMSTRLWGWRVGSSEPRTLTYAEVLQLGANDREELRWLWRSNLKAYYALAPVWERWLYRILRRWKSLRAFVGTKWVSGFELNDRIKRLEEGTATPEDKERVDSLFSRPDFWRMCNVLIAELRNALP